MEKYCFCFDIDGTLLPSNHQITESTLNTLKTLQERGHKIVVATGRNFGSVKDSGVIEMFDWDGYVLNNGQCVLDKDFNEVFVEKMDPELVQKVIDITNQEGLVCLLERVKDWFIVQDASESTKVTHDFFRVSLPEKNDYDPSMEIVMFIVYAPKGYDYKPYKELKELQVDEGNSEYADIVKAGYHKYKGIEKMLEYFNIKKSVCFGDGSNDVQMIKGATIGVAMGNACQSAKDASDFITLSCNHDGITYACEKLRFLKEEDIPFYY